MNFTLYTADCVGNEKNCIYRNRVEITSPGELALALAYDHTCGAFKNNYRKKENFIGSNCIVMDFDNDHSEDPSEWLTPDKIASLLPDINLERRVLAATYIFASPIHQAQQTMELSRQGSE